MNSPEPSWKSVALLRHLLLPAVVLAFFSGCASKEFTYATVVSGGETMRFTIVAGRPLPAKADGVEIQEAGILPDPETKKVFYGFRFADSRTDRVWKSVRVEDVSEPQPILLLEETEPKLVFQRWVAKTRQFEADDPALKWVFYVNDSVRIYRFTLTSADGRTLVLHQAGMVPAWMKAAIRHLFGEKY